MIDLARSQRPDAESSEATAAHEHEYSPDLASEPELQIVDGFALAAVPPQEQPVRVLGADEAGKIIADDRVAGHVILAS